MNNESRIKKIKSFTDLNVWKESHALVLQVYKLTSNFPKEETFVLVSQMRRCVVSVSSNIAEGFSRQSFKEKVQFYSMSLGSITELQNQLLIARDLGFITSEDFKLLAEKSVVVHKLLNGIIKSSRSMTHDS